MSDVGCLILDVQVPTLKLETLKLETLNQLFNIQNNPFSQFLSFGC